ncbi:uracil phosphoribosyltransferase-domain-containing protein [Microdochium trichocladiopsis]|uniref:uracil phosphoribosyltransferase n=1 Tax=Microdochium trichocladiopsis TaxID=1682393 RepID=A0A9P8YAA1_9PEZI|nr:uracil phosphoribosyltransferase-domain-containing protein [Microdochium trichocladiopsis]KAH7033481.1 uracil phosphoribosyltransferase-domain-containing protein [Microdochium trichocladiopsis]
MAKTFTVPSDPEASKLLAQLRDTSLPPAVVRRVTRDLTASLTKHVLSLPAPPSSPTANDSEQVAVIVVLRSGLAMVDPVMDFFPDDADTVIYHLGMFREKVSLQPVEYYNKLPPKNPRIKHAYVLDPLVATGGTATAVIGILKDWGVEKITLFSLLGSRTGLEAVANVWPEGTEVFAGGVDDGLDDKGYVKPGVGDIGDRLFGTALS